MSEVRLVLRAGSSHLYPGAAGTAHGALPHGAEPCLVEFADGAATLATLTPGEDRHVLATEPYTTARGTRIPAKRWVIAVTGGNPELSFRVLRRAA